MYQHSGYGLQNNYYFVTRIKINAVIEKHVRSHSGYAKYYGNFGSWQGSLNTGTHTIIVEYRNNGGTKNEPQYWQTDYCVLLNYCKSIGPFIVTAYVVIHAVLFCTHTYTYRIEQFCVHTYVCRRHKYIV